MQTIKTSLASLVAFKKMEAIPNLGRFQINLESPGTLSGADADGQLFPLGYGTTFLVQTDAVAYFASVGCCVLDATLSPVEAAETLTNTDKRPHMSAAEQMVTLALRRMNRKAREMKQAQKDVEVVDEDVQPEPDPAPAPTPTPDPEPDPNAATGPSPVDASPAGSGASPK